MPWGIGCDLRLDLGRYGRNSNYPDLFRGSLAVAANVEYIVTNNLRDFSYPELKHANFEVISPEHLIKEI